VNAGIDHIQLNQQPRRLMLKLQINPTGLEEVIEIFIDPVKHPIAYKNKFDELIESGMTREEAEELIRTTPFEMEFYYSKNQGLFLVESEPLEYITIYNPYDGEAIPNPEFEE